MYRVHCRANVWKHFGNDIFAVIWCVFPAKWIYDFWSIEFSKCNDWSKPQFWSNNFPQFPKWGLKKVFTKNSSKFKLFFIKKIVLQKIVVDKFFETLLVSKLDKIKKNRSNFYLFTRWPTKLAQFGTVGSHFIDADSRLIDFAVGVANYIQPMTKPPIPNLYGSVYQCFICSLEIWVD